MNASLVISVLFYSPGLEFLAVIHNWGGGVGVRGALLISKINIFYECTSSD